jgi:trimethylamine--corrinoid protein Co-methyltransferase
MVKDMLRPLTFDDQNVPLDLIARVGPGGNFLMEDHTVETFRRSFWFPRFLDRDVYEIWEEKGSKDLRTALNERARSILESRRPAGLSEETVCSIRDVVATHKPDVEAAG